MILQSNTSHAKPANPPTQNSARERTVCTLLPATTAVLDVVSVLSKPVSRPRSERERRCWVKRRVFCFLFFFWGCKTYGFCFGRIKEIISSILSNQSSVWTRLSVPKSACKISRAKYTSQVNRLWTLHAHVHHEKRVLQGQNCKEKEIWPCSP